MILSYDVANALHERLCARTGLALHKNPPALRALLRAAAEVGGDEPSALLWACGRHPRALGAAWVPGSVVLVEYQAYLCSTLVVLSVDEMRSVLVDVARGTCGHELVRVWLAERSMPLPPGMLGPGGRGQG